MLEISDETRRIGRQVQAWLAQNKMSREQFAVKIGYGKGIVDKLCSGRFTQRTLDRVAEVTDLVFRKYQAHEMLGSYERERWIKYEGQYVMVEYKYDKKFDGNILVQMVELYWNESTPGFFLDYGRRGGANIGVLSIPHERSPIIYIRLQNREGRYIAVSTMVGEKAMRGLKLAVQKVVANAFVPTVTPIVFMELSEDLRKHFPKSCEISPTDERYLSVRKYLDNVILDQYGIIAPMFTS